MRRYMWYNGFGQMGTTFRKQRKSLGWIESGCENQTVYDNLILDNVGTSKMKRKLRQNLIWISRAWENISEQTIIDAFLSSGISNNLDGTDDRVSEKFPSLNEGGLRGELGDLLFDSDTDSKLDFDEFDECDI